MNSTLWTSVIHPQPSFRRWTSKEPLRETNPKYKHWCARPGAGRRRRDRPHRQAEDLVPDSAWPAQAHGGARQGSERGDDCGATVKPPMSMPRMALAWARASSGEEASLIPPAFPRLPVGTCALTTQGPMAWAAVAASSAVRAIWLGGTVIA